MLAKIEIGSHNGRFDWILENENHAQHAPGNSDMIRELVKSHNQMVDILNKMKGDLYELSYFLQGSSHVNAKSFEFDSRTVWINPKHIEFVEPTRKNIGLGKLASYAKVGMVSGNIYFIHKSECDILIKTLY